TRSTATGATRSNSIDSFKRTRLRRRHSRRGNWVTASPSRRSKTGASDSRSSREAEMSTPRRRIVRPAPRSDQTPQQRQRRAQTLRGRLAGERAALARWVSRLKRAFHTMERLQARVARLDRQLATLEEP